MRAWREVGVHRLEVCAVGERWAGERSEQRVQL